MANAIPEMAKAIPEAAANLASQAISGFADLGKSIADSLPIPSGSTGSKEEATEPKERVLKAGGSLPIPHIPGLPAVKLSGQADITMPEPGTFPGSNLLKMLTDPAGTAKSSGSNAPSAAASPQGSGAVAASGAPTGQASGNIGATGSGGAGNSAAGGGSASSPLDVAANIISAPAKIAGNIFGGVMSGGGGIFG
ncbi:unnamed protein product [Chrysodeixis includens]|uniref:Uncharacterized protein n=1 Tax=Chrysodeixis includens TaxID=689277 RepID=A0A9N8KX79_CHRIL|nr:unnamed protein product [Chrysodeixis includens]